MDRRGSGSVLHELQDGGCRIVQVKRMGSDEGAGYDAAACWPQTEPL